MITLDKNFSSAHNGLAEIYSKLRQPEKASIHFKKSINNSPKLENSISNYILNHNYCLKKTIEEKFSKTMKFSNKLIGITSKLEGLSEVIPVDLSE